MRVVSAASLLAVLAFVPVACRKPQVSGTASPLPVNANSPSTPAPARVAPENTARFTGEVRRGEPYIRSIGPNLIFRLQPDAGNDSGWTIRMIPGMDEKALLIDCIGAVSEPAHNNRNLYIEPPDSAAQAATPAWQRHEFDFVRDAANCKVAWDLMNSVYYASKLTDEQRAEAGEKLGKIPTGHGSLTIVDSRLAPSATAGDPPVVEYLKFDVELSMPPPAQLAAATELQPQPGPKGIRGVDLAAFLNAHYAQVNPELDLETECGEGQKPIQSIAPFQYGDLDGDGTEEAAFMAFTCMSGTGGVDFFGVLKLQSDGKIVALPIQDAPKSFKGRDPSAGLRGHMRLEIQNDKLLEIFPTYPDEKACNNCSEGEREFLYRWDGHKFVLGDIIDVPPEQSTHSGS